MPERLGLPDVPDPGDEPLVEQGVAELAASGARLAAWRPCRRGLAARRGCPAPGGACRGWSARAPARSRAPPRARPRSARATACHAVSAPRSSTCQRPLMRRWLRRTSPPSKLRSRFLPTASTASSRRPSSRSAASAAPRADAASRPRRARRPAPAAGAPRGGESLPRASPGYASVAVILRALPMLVAVATATACGAQSSVGPDLGRCRAGGDLSGLAGLSRREAAARAGEALPTRFLAKGRSVFTTTDARGRYRVRLERGRYSVRPVNGRNTGRKLGPPADACAGHPGPLRQARLHVRPGIR